MLSALALRERYGSIDPRTLGLLRVALGALLLFDLGKRLPDLDLWFLNASLLPNHRLLWRPSSPFQLSYLFALWTSGQVQVAFVLMAVVYLGFLVGYRTRWMHLLSWFALLSLHTRTNQVVNGGDYVFCTLLLWTAFLPLGRRFSVDAWLAGRQGAAEVPDASPVISLAVFGLLFQLAVIYAFNALHKTGTSWAEGSSVYYMLHQARIVTAFGVWLREHAPFWSLRGLSHGTLLVEYALPLLIFLPWLGAWPRRLAIVLLWGFHGSIALLSNLGLFSPVMMTFALILVGRDDWIWIERRLGPTLGAWRERWAAAFEPLAPWLTTPARSDPARESTGFGRRVRRARVVARELGVVVLLLLAASQLVQENPALPRALAHEQPRFVRAAIGYLRFNQGWSMFAPEAPRSDMSIVIDAVTVSGRHLDPLNARGSIVADPGLREIPARLGHDVYFCDYVARIVDDPLFHQPLHEWIFNQGKRTQDPIVRFDAYVLEQDSPTPGSSQPTNRRWHVFLNGTHPE